VTIDRRPALAGVLAAERECRPMLLIVADRSHARFFLLGPLAARELPPLRFSGQSRGGRFHSDRGDAPGVGEKSFHARREEEWRRHAARVWHQAGELAAREEVREVILGGHYDDIEVLERDRPAGSTLTIRGRILLNPTALTEAMAFAAGSEQRAAARRLDDRALVKEMEEAVGTGSGVNGARETLRALIKGQLRTLLVPESQRGAGFRCPSTGEFVIAAVDCASDTPPEPIADLISWIIPEALSKRVEVAVVGGDEAAQAIDGLAGILRFR
jgi:peptide subunit release factor 1 (eRF1)